MVRYTCCIPQCRSNRKKAKTDENIKISLFSTPKDADLFKKWQEAIPHHKLTSEDKVCDRHFNDEDVKRFYFQTLKDGTLHQAKVGKVTLKLGAVPCLFSELEFVEDTRKRKSTAVMHRGGTHEIITGNTEQTCNKMNVDDTEKTSYEIITADTEETHHEMITDNIEETCHQIMKDDNVVNLVSHDEVPLLNFTDILNDITSVFIPTDLWGVTATKEFIIFSRWTKENDYNLLKKMVIESDLNVRRFFSIMRNACGCNDHPDSTTFIQVFRLVGMYSLIQPPKGSNVTGSDMVKSILNLSDLPDVNNAHQKFNSRLELLLKTGSKTVEVQNSEDHSYSQQNSPDCVVGFLAGFVAFRGKNMSKCDNCQKCLFLSEEDVENINPNDYALIEEKTYGFLSKPSPKLLSLISTVEKCAMNVLSSQKLNLDTLSDIVNKLEQVNHMPLLGCFEHKYTFTKSLLSYYLILRMTFICSRENKIDDIKAQKSRKYKKLSKL